MRDVLAALSDPVRLEMLRRLDQASGPMACSDLYEDISKSTASHHFSVLRRSGIITSTPRGTGREVALCVEDLPSSVRDIVDATLRALRASR